ncbi:MAG: methionine adenosyltransferase [Bacilli bacterium]|jgi:S-adenosylmethionine synthetase|nr:methionine adenosyltransferase [Bacilli bacterium]MCH4235886.1 methionine adenosyltransferase [Bacilli bacterium]
MREEKILFTSESVSEGHPDKLCDQISDAILDACLKQDANSRVACETFATREYILISGEITTLAKVDYESIARKVLRKIGYNNPEDGIGADSCRIDIRIDNQSPDISVGIDHGNELNQGAGDQGIMFGYATDESEGYMPLAVSISHKLVRIASTLRKNGEFIGARPDMKSQVTIDYSGLQPRIDTCLMSVQHTPSVDENEFRRFIHEKIMIPVAESFHLNTDFRFLINPTGRFVIGGPRGDTGLTGRKIIVDTYGGTARHGGGAFSGKDPSKVDRSGAYMARYIAKNLVAAGIAKRMEVQLSYAIGVAEPVSIGIATYGTSKYDDRVILSIIDKFFDCRPGAITKMFDLKHPKGFAYENLAAYGHFGRPDLKLPWEELDKVELIKAEIAAYSQK